jgi:hypothetical protein
MQGERGPTHQVRRRRPSSFQREENEPQVVILSCSLKRCLARRTVFRTARPQPAIEKLPELNRHAQVTQKILSRNKLKGERKVNHLLSRALGAPS